MELSLCIQIFPISKSRYFLHCGKLTLKIIWEDGRWGDISFPGVYTKSLNYIETFPLESIYFCCWSFGRCLQEMMSRESSWSKEPLLWSLAVFGREQGRSPCLQCTESCTTVTTIGCTIIWKCLDVATPRLFKGSKGLWNN